MAEGLFLDGINLESGGGGVAEAEEFAALIDANEAEARLAGADVAVARAEVAVEAAIGVGSPPEGFVEGGGFLENLQFGHWLRLLGVSIRLRRGRNEFRGRKKQDRR